MDFGVNVAIIGCGLIGRKRALVLDADRLVAVCDPNPEAARAIAKGHSPPPQVFADWEDALAVKSLDAVIIATPHHLLAPITRRAIELGLAVLVEKPAGLSAAELEGLASFARERSALVRVGFNHRYHPAFREIHSLRSREDFGELMFIRGRYGQGGRVGMEKEWRARPELSGGGELIDQGVHLIDLSRQFLNDITEVEGWAHTYFWDMPVEDNGFMLLKDKQHRAAFLQVSCTEWKNLFNFEIYFQKAKLDVTGLGGSYGVERLSVYRMLPEMGPPDTTIYEYPRGDDSWEYEWKQFREDAELRRTPGANLDDALAAMRVVNQIYALSGRAPA